MPSRRREAKASDSAWPQSIPPSSRAARRRSSWRRSFGLIVNLDGDRHQLLGEASQALLSHPGLDGGRHDHRDGLVVRLRRDLLPERRPKAVVRLAEPGSDGLDLRRGLVLAEDPLADELSRVELAHRRVALDLGGHDRLRVRGLVLLVVAEAAVADEVDDDVVAEAAAVGHREPDGRDRGLRVIGVDVNDRRVEALREVGRVPGRPALRRVGGEADLVVGDDVEGPAGRVALERVQVERLGDDPLARERGVAVQQDREREPRVVCPVAGRAVGLICAGHPLDDGVDGLEMARIGREGDRDRPGGGLAAPFGAEVVLDVACPALHVGGDDLDRPLAFELADDLLVRHADRVREDVEAAAVCHADHGRAAAGGCAGLERLVEHRDQDVEPLERELLLAEERAPEVALHLLDLAEAGVEAALLLEHQRGAVTP